MCAVLRVMMVMVMLMVMVMEAVGIEKMKMHTLGLHIYWL